MGKKIEGVEAVRKSLLDQLKKQNKNTDYYIDMVEDYIYFWDLKEKCQKDIDENGIRYSVTTGNGFETLKANESVLNVLKINMQMLKILTALDLKVEEIKKKVSPY